ncbi:hypothetical protein GF325_03620 [Candidatus Bathyarchaeota archaeon]|nr:hypothetical protein [Candidatus Bathyarchaeota archaeon]
MPCLILAVLINHGISIEPMETPPNRSGSHHARDASVEPRRCCVRNCPAIVDERTGVKIGDNLFCKQCAVYYMKSKLPFLG